MFWQDDFLYFYKHPPCHGLKIHLNFLLNLMLFFKKMKINKCIVMSALFSVTFCSAVMGMEGQKYQEQTIKKAPNKRNAKSANKEQNKSHSPITAKRQKIDSDGKQKVPLYLITTRSKSKKTGNVPGGVDTLNPIIAEKSREPLKNNSQGSKMSFGCFLNNTENLKKSSDQDMCVSLKLFNSSSSIQKPEEMHKRISMGSIKQKETKDVYRPHEKYNPESVAQFDTESFKKQPTSLLAVCNKAQHKVENARAFQGELCMDVAKDDQEELLENNSSDYECFISEYSDVINNNKNPGTIVETPNETIKLLENKQPSKPSKKKSDDFKFTNIIKNQYLSSELN